ncbi:MAG TPA: nitronate monooxygenase [Steroidobacteraceae bacterium]|nr:nitronate monooxygenase [Steroidobacteraceae bacterium]
MWTQTRVTQALNLRLPIIQGPFGGGPSSIPLAAAVSNAGGLGSFGAYSLSPDQLKQLVIDLRSATRHSFAVNLWVPFDAPYERRITEPEYRDAVALLQPYYDRVGAAAPSFGSLFRTQNFGDQVDALLEAAPPAFSFVFGIPKPEVLRACRERKIVTMGAATNVDEAVALDDAGVDIIVATGSEAGGHRVSFLNHPDESPANSALIPQVTQLVKAPVVVAGGIADGRGIVAALMWGAGGVQIGTAFLACDESNATADHKAAIRSQLSRHTALTRAFSGRYARAIKNRFLLDMQAHEASLPAFPYQNFLTQPLRQAAAKSGDSNYQSLWAGQNAPLVSHTKATELMDFLVRDTENTLTKLQALSA